MHTSRKFKLSLRIETIENIFSVISIELRFGIFTKFWAIFVLSRLTKEKLRRNDRKEKINKNRFWKNFLDPKSILKMSWTVYLSTR